MLKSFKVQILLYLIGIFICILLIGITILNDQTNVYLLFLIPILIGLTWQLFWLIDKTNREIERFLDSIKYNDYEAHFSESKNISSSFRSLHQAFNTVTEKFRAIRSEKEAQFQYLQAIVENVDTGLICFNSEGKTVLINKGLQQLLHKSYFPNFKAVQQFNQALFTALNEITPGERKLVKLVVNNQLIQLAIRKTILHIKEDSLHLYALQNIHSELEEQEISSWQKLIRILTHEIMNSVTPVVSLSATAKQMMEGTIPISEETEEDIKKAIQAIHRRSAGLLHFTQTYRQLTKMPPPRFELCKLLEIIESVLTLLQPELDKQNIQLERLYKDKGYELQLDPDLMEQVFINLLKNAMDALQGIPEACISMHVFKSLNDEIEIQISDNGPGIPSDLLDKIFIPFFTTKKEGSGIGLSLSRQIVQMHKGNLFVHSEEGGGTVFTIRI